MTFRNALTAGIVAVISVCPAGAATLGDLDANGSVQPHDGLLALRFAAGLAKPTSADVATGDVASASGNTGDQRLTLVDAVRILRAGAGLDNLGSVGSSGSGLLPKFDSIAFSANFSRDYQLSAGFRLSGVIRDMAAQPLDYAYMQFAPPGNTGYYFALADQNGKYATVVPSGTYTAKVNSTYDLAGPNDESGSISAAISALPNVNVTKDTVQDYTQPALPPTGAITGTLPAPVTTFVSSVSGDVISGTYQDASSQGSSTGVSYWLPTLPGDVEPEFTVIDFNNPTGSTSVSLRPAVSVAAGAMVTRNLSLLPFVKVTNAITAPAALGAPGSITYSTKAATGDLYRASGAGATPSVSLPSGDYDVQINFFNGGLSATYLTTATVPAAGGPQTFALPALPASVTFTGKVTGPTGQPVEGAYVSLTSQAPIAGYSLGAFTQTSATGAFSLTFPKGSYFVTISDPA